MAEIYYGPDALRWYLSGASSDGGTQTDPLMSLGGYRSSTMAKFLGISGTPPTNLTVTFAGGKNGPGTGTLATGTGSYSGMACWTAPSGSVGDYVTLTSGSTKVLKSSDTNKYIIVTCSGTLTDSQSTTITLSDVYNDIIGGQNVTSAEATSGVNFYLATFLKCHCPTTVLGIKTYLTTLGTQRTSNSTYLSASGAGTIGTTGSFSDWPATGWCRVTSSGGSLKEIVYYSSRSSTVLTVPSTGRARLDTSATAGASDDAIDAVPGIRIAKEVPSSSSIQTIANIYTAPTSLTWSTGISTSTGLTIGDLAENALIGLWIHSEYPESTVAVSSQLKSITVAFDAAP